MPAAASVGMFKCPSARNNHNTPKTTIPPYHKPHIDIQTKRLTRNTRNHINILGRIREYIMPELRVGLLVVSDTAAADHATDRAIDTLTAVLAEANADADLAHASYEWLVDERRIVPDEKEAIQDKIREWCDVRKLNLVLTTGGTGFGVRDITPEAVSEMLDKTASGLVYILPFSEINIPY
ncbi:Gephyrin [Orbilia brochopaga]|nr:Gephyrin [Drechslerella brochopaga]